MIDVVLLGSSETSFTRYYPPGMGKPEHTQAYNLRDLLMIEKWNADYGLSVLFRGVGRPYSTVSINEALMELQTYPGYDGIGCVAVDLPHGFQALLVERWAQSRGDARPPRLIMGSGGSFHHHPMCRYVGMHMTNEMSWRSVPDDYIQSWDRDGRMVEPLEHGVSAYD